MHRVRKPTHPGEVLLEDVIKPLGLTVTEAAKRFASFHQFYYEKLKFYLQALLCEYNT